MENVSFTIGYGQTLGVVGESGCGKSVTARSILGILDDNGKILDGEIIFRPDGPEGRAIDLAKLDPRGREMRSIRGSMISMIFQEPMTSFNPVHTIGEQIRKPFCCTERWERRPGLAGDAGAGGHQAPSSGAEYPHAKRRYAPAGKSPWPSAGPSCSSPTSLPPGCNHQAQILISCATCRMSWACHR